MVAAVATEEERKESVGDGNEELIKGSEPPGTGSEGGAAPWLVQYLLGILKAVNFLVPSLAGSVQDVDVLQDAAS